MLRFGALCHLWGEWIGGYVDRHAALQWRLRHRLGTHVQENVIKSSPTKNSMGCNDLRTTLRYHHVTNKSIQCTSHPLGALLRKLRKPPT
jgi:hypothetical protein